MGRAGLLGLMPCCLGLDSERQGLAVVSHARRSEEVGGYIYTVFRILSRKQLSRKRDRIHVAKWPRVVMCAQVRVAKWPRVDMSAGGYMWPFGCM